MPFLQLNDAQFPLATGETRVGRGEEVEIRIAGDEGEETAAVISLAGDGQAWLRRSGGGGEIIVNGILVGREPTPLLHGDRLTILGCELRYADEALGGATLEMPAFPGAAVATASASALEAHSGGRLVSLTDGREYAVPPAGLMIGRAAQCDVIVLGPAVSRRHARIEAGGEAGGYDLVDMSRNGVAVNGARVVDRLPLASGDTIEVGDETFRFHAESMPAAETRTLADVPSLQVTETSIPTTPRGVPVVPPRRPSPLAWLEILNPGPSRGERFELATPLSHVGRGEYNDVIVVDESVSDAHAKILRREGSWRIVDMESTNGTYINGERISGEVPLDDGALVRFGGVKMSFHVAGGASGTEGQTRVVVGIKGRDPARGDARVRAPALEKREDEPARKPAVLVWAVVAALGAILVYLVLQGR